MGLVNIKTLAFGYAKKILFYHLKNYFIYYVISFYNTLNVSVSQFLFLEYNLLK